jgi:cell division cycle 14
MQDNTTHDTFNHSRPAHDHYAKLVQLIPGKLAFTSGIAAQIQDLKRMVASEEVVFITSDLHRKYLPFAADFGPVNIGIVHRFCDAFVKRLAKPGNSLFVYCIEPTVACRANACFLLAAFMVLRNGWSPEQAAKTFQPPALPFTLEPFRDAAFAEPTFGLSIYDCLLGLARAVALGWYDHATFDRASYDALGDPFSLHVHQICPKLVALKGPLPEGSPHLRRGEPASPPSAYIPALQRLGVTCVLRLNEPDTYDRLAAPSFSIPSCCGLEMPPPSFACGGRMRRWG